jgi:catechol 2,3-dioxygenase-like lactoylglutathione lyase family enzyme
VRVVKIEKLDHVALWIPDRDRLAEFLTTHVGMHEIERTDAFTLVGADARRGKLTLFAVDGEREPGALLRTGLCVGDLDAALARLPSDLAVERSDSGEACFEAPGGLGLALVERSDCSDYDLDYVVLRAMHPVAATNELRTLGLDGVDGELAAGGASIRVVGGDPGDPERSLLNHLGLLVASADEHLDEAKERGLEIDKVVDAENTRAVFVFGPERIKLEYVEHKKSFSLV